MKIGQGLVWKHLWYFRSKKCSEFSHTILDISYFVKKALKRSYVKHALLITSCYIHHHQLLSKRHDFHYQNIALASKSLKKDVHAQWILLRRGYLLPYPSPVTYALAHEWSGKKYISFDNYRTIILYKRKLGENDYGTQGLFDFLWVVVFCSCRNKTQC